MRRTERGRIDTNVSPKGPSAIATNGQEHISFAVALSLGVIASLFTALIVSRMIFDYILMNRQAKTLSI